MPGKHRMVETVCLTCSSRFLTTAHKLKIGKGKYCSMDCYREGSRRPKRAFEERFWSKVQKDEEGCWIWTGTTNGKGYGQFSVGGRGVANWRTRSAHKVSWELAYGPVPDGLLIRHFVCARPLCVRPDHLRLGTKRDNAEDARRDGTLAVGERSSSAKLTDAQVAEIRQLLGQGVQQRMIAKTFGVNHRIISNIFVGKHWKHIP